MQAPAPTTPARPAPLLTRERIAILGALAGITVLSWLYLFASARSMDRIAGAMAPWLRPWTATEAALMVAMWWVMMIGMMLPSAAPMILMFAAVNRNKRAQGKPYVPTMVFLGGYLAAWGAYSLAAAVAQGALERAALMTPMMNLASPALGGALFLVAGVYQLTPLKGACLRHCRSPLAFVLNHWRDGTGGAFSMGAAHGTFCLGCCAVLMALLFVFGVMNLLWVAVLAAFVLVEKLVPAGDWIARIGGAGMIAFGLYRLFTA